MSKIQNKNNFQKNTSFIFLSIGLVIVLIYIVGAILINLAFKPEDNPYNWNIENCTKIVNQYKNEKNKIDNFEDGFRVDPGPPFRIVFINYRGVVDNWNGIIYDPSKEIEKIINYDQVGWESWWNDPNLNSLKSIFGGDVAGCKKMDDWGDDWYFCSFT
ncbi:hypothetical protein GF360_03475 [candidate division WWE3 bacterium]|nr:hypothetical protein [candidate division WWE3 bacterium]